MKPQRRLRFALLLVVAVSLLFFVLGLLAVKRGWLSESVYSTVATVLGGAASLIGLLSLARPAITTEDLENLERDALTRVTAVARDLDEARRARAATQEELQQLEAQRIQMQALVRKAAMELFLEERLARHRERLAERLAGDRELAQLVESVASDSAQLRAIGLEVRADPNEALLREIVETIRSRERNVTHDWLQALLGASGQIAERLLGRVGRF